MKFYSIYQYDDAIVSFSKAINNNKSNANHYVNRASAYYKTKKYIESSNDFRKVLLLDSNNLKAIDGLLKIEKINNGKLEK